MKNIYTFLFPFITFYSFGQIQTKYAGSQFYSNSYNTTVISTKYAGSQYYYNYTTPNISISNYKTLAEKAEAADKIARYNFKYCNEVLENINKVLPSVIDPTIKDEMIKIKDKINNFPNVKAYHEISDELVEIVKNLNLLIKINTFDLFMHSINQKISDNKFNEAIELLNEISTEDEDILYWKNYNLAISYNGLNDYKMSLYYANKLKDDLYKKVLIGNIKYDAEDFYGALSINDEILAEGKFSEDYKKDYFINEKANALLKLKKFDEALNEINNAIDINKNEGNYLDTKGEILFNLGKIQEAITILNESIKLFPQQNSFFIRGQSYLKQNRIKEGCTDLSKAFELGNEDALKIIKVKCK